MGMLIYYIISVLVSLFMFYQFDKQAAKDGTVGFGFLRSLIISIIFGMVLAPINIVYRISQWDWVSK